MVTLPALSDLAGDEDVAGVGIEDERRLGGGQPGEGLVTHVPVIRVLDVHPS